jgi:hypothetical protein
VTIGRGDRVNPVSEGRVIEGDSAVRAFPSGGAGTRADGSTGP